MQIVVDTARQRLQNGSVHRRSPISITGALTLSGRSLEFKHSLIKIRQADAELWNDTFDVPSNDFLVGRPELVGAGCDRSRDVDEVGVPTSSATLLNTVG